VTDPAVRARRGGLHARAFALARAALGSSVRRIDMSPYELSSERLGYFDFVFMGVGYPL